MGKKTAEIYSSIELGSGTIKVVVGEFAEDDTLRIAGLAEVPSLKVLKGEITDATIVHEQLGQALEQAERQAGVDIHEVFLAVSCGNIGAINSQGSSPATGPDHTICENDIRLAVDNAQADGLPPDRKLLQTFDRRYLIDGTREVNNPLNQVGRKVVADIHIVYGQYANIENICRLVEGTLGYPAADICFSGIAAGFGVLSQEEMERGTLVIDLGAGTTQYILFHGAGVYHSGQVTVGVDHLANDVSIGIGVPLVKARNMIENLADHEASAVMNPDGHYRRVRLQQPGLGTRQVPTSTIETIIELRLRELFDIILEDLLKQSAMARVVNGITLVGGGALIHGADELARQVFNLPVRIGRPRLVSSLHNLADSPKFVTPIGLLRWGREVKRIAEVKTPLAGQVCRDAWKTILKLVNWIKRALQW